MSQPITRFRGENFFLSNMADVPAGIITTSGVTVPNVEVAYQAGKFALVTDVNTILAVSDGKLAKRQAHEMLHEGCPAADDWDAIKVPFMTSLVRQKFWRDRELGTRLIGTADRRLAEGNPWGDNFWGDSPEGSNHGANHLGKILMKVRREVKQNRELERKLNSWSIDTHFSSRV